jgi:Flp pilus assembly CpaE family ATPase
MNVIFKRALADPQHVSPTPQTDAPNTTCRSVVVLGATEGSGGTTLCVNLAGELAGLLNHHCILGEQSVAFGRLANLLRISPHLTLYDLVSNLEALDAGEMRKALTKIDDNLSVLVGSYLAVRPITITREIAFKVLECTLQLAETVIVDARHNFDDIDFEFASNVEHLVLVGKPTMPSLRCLRTVVETFARRGTAGKRYVVINQYHPNDDVSSKDAIERFLDVPDVLLVSADPEAVEAAENSGTMLRTLYPDRPVVKDIAALARTMLGLPPEAASRPGVRQWLELIPGLVKRD